MSMKRSYTASAYDLSLTTNILNANITLIGKMRSEMTSRMYTPLELPSPESGPSQEGATILVYAAHSIGLIPIPLFELETASQSSFDPTAQVFVLITSKYSLPDMEDGDEHIKFAPVLGKTAGVKDMKVKRAEREKRKSTDSVKNKNKSEDDESSQNKRQISEGIQKSVPTHPGKTMHIQ